MTTLCMPPERLLLLDISRKLPDRGKHANENAASGSGRVCDLYRETSCETATAGPAGRVASMIVRKQIPKTKANSNEAIVPANSPGPLPASSPGEFFVVWSISNEPWPLPLVPEFGRFFAFANATNPGVLAF
jgi:hypothetical protein